VTGFDFTKWLNQFQFHVDPTFQNLITRQGLACRDCSRSTVFGPQARFGFGTIVTPSPLPCCTTAPTSTPQTCKCGVEGQHRIVGGTVSTAGKYPWIGAVNFNNNEGKNPGGCAATLIAAQWAVTAAHCVPGRTKDTMSVVFGEFDLTVIGDSNDGRRRNVKLVLDPIVHESYRDPFTDSNDIALLKLETVNIGVYAPACLPTQDKDYTGRTGHVYGWGSTSACPTITSYDQLREVSLPILSDTDCNDASGEPLRPTTTGECLVDPNAAYSGLISEDMLCAGETGKDSCQGDSGGPFTVKEGDRHYLAGVVSWGFGCGGGLPGVYSEVAKNRNWIDGKISANGGASYCPT